MGKGGRQGEGLGIGSMRGLWKRLIPSSGAAGSGVLTATTQLADQLIAQGNACEDAGEFDAALDRYREALSIAPNYPRAHLNVGNALRLLGRLREAVAAQREALRCNSAYPPAHFNLATLLIDSGDAVRAEAHLRKALDLDPGMASAAVVLADVLDATGRVADAEAALYQAISIRPDFAGAMLNLGQLYLRQSRLDEAEDLLVQALAIDPTLVGGHCTLASVYRRTGRFSDEGHAMARALALDPELRQYQSSYLFSLSLRGDVDTSAIFAEHTRLGAGIAKAAGTPYKTWAKLPNTTRRLKLGYVSGDFSMHPVGLFMRPVLQHHNRADFDVHCYSNRTSEDPLTQALQASVENWRSIAGFHDRLVAEQIRRDEIDVLVDLSGHTDGNSLGVFALRPAPVQVTWLGYLNTTGLPVMDYRICDRHTDPEGVAEHLHIERLYRMPHSQWCYVPVYDVPLILQPHFEDPGSIVFGSFNQYAKISDACLDLWCKVLGAVAGSKLVVLDVPPGKARDLLRDRLISRGTDPDRVSIRGREAIVDYFTAIGNVDIALDTFPYNGGTTTFDTLWMGVPVVVQLGDRGVARSGYSVMQSLQMPELIAAGADEYVAINLRFAGDARWRSELRRTLRQRLAGSPLMDVVRFVADLEAGYRQMWRTWCNAQAWTR